MANIAIFRINYKSDFILTLNSDAGWMTPFCIKFWTGAPSRAYFVGFDGITYTHCAPVDGEPTKLRVQFDDHRLPIGDLKFQIGYHFTVADFPTSVEDEVLNQASVIIEVDDVPAQVMLDLNGETAPEIEFSLPAYANEAQRIANEEQRIAHEQQRITNEDARIQAEETRQYNEQQRIQHEEYRVSEFARLKSESEAATDAANTAATLANEKAQLAADKAALAQAAATLANDKAQLAADKAALAQAAATLANDKAALAQQKAEYAQTQGDYAKAQGDYAKAQGDTAQADHERAEADHTTAADDHSRAEGDHTTAASDHSRAESDHTTAASDHSRAESDHTTAASDHTRAESDHTTAASDHETAASDHTRAESDHAAVEVYVDSLGAFDISSYHATGGELAKYADLTAALGTDGANIPEGIRKGGMSVKFVQSSDNKYIQARLMADSFTTDVTQWQVVVDEPIKESKDLISSGGVYKRLGYSTITKNISVGENYPKIEIDYITGENKIFYFCEIDKHPEITFYLIYTDNSYEYLGKIPTIGCSEFNPNPNKTVSKIGFLFRHLSAEAMSVKLIYCYPFSDTNLLEDFSAIKLLRNNINSSKCVFSGNISYPQFNFKFPANSGDELFVRIASGFSNISSWQIYQFKNDDTYIQKTFTDPIGNITIGENYNGNIRVIFYFKNNVDTNICINYGKLKQFGDVDNIALENFNNVKTLEDNVKTLEDKVFGTFYGTAKELSQTFAGTEPYPQFNFQYQAEQGDELYIRLVKPLNIREWQIYQFKNDNTYTATTLNEPIGKITIGDNYNGNIRVITYFNSQVETKVTIRYGSAEQFGDVDKITEDYELWNDVFSPKIDSILIFQRVGCIGDSYTSGHIQLKGGTVISSNPNYAYPHFLEKMTGSIYTNFGRSGASTKSYFQTAFDEMGVGAQGNKCQAYIMGLGINDSGYAEIPAGVASDIGTNNDTYTAWYYKLVQKVLSEVNESAKIFMCTMPRVNVNDYNQAVKNIVSYCRNNGQTNVFLCDLYSYMNKYYYQNSYLNRDFVNGHYTAVGYEIFGECIYRIISKVIRKNQLYFQNVHLIPYDNPT